MSKIENLKQRFRAELSEAKAIAERAESAGRDLTENERASISGKVESAQRLKAQIEQEQKDNGLRTGLESLGADLGTMGANSSGMKANSVPAKVRASGGSGEWAKAVTDYCAHFGSKSLIANGTVPVTVPMVAEPIRDNVPVLSLRQLIPAEAETAGVWKYLRQTTRTNNASTVATGKKKPTSVYTWTEVEGRSRVIAHLSEPIPKQLLDDATALRQVLEAEMRLGLEVELEDQVINGNGSTTGVLDDMVGILNTSGTQTQAWDTAGDEFTTTRKAVTKLENSSIAPTGWVMNPNSWERFELQVDTNSRYMLGNAPVDRAARRLWGLPVALTTAIADNTAVLADFANATKLRVRQEGTLDWTENRYDPNKFGAGVGGSEFEANQITFRFEGRFGLDVMRPFSIVEVDLTDPA
ncbi:phage major capsid protein [Spirillospora sp. NPDC049024]